MGAEKALKLFRAQYYRDLFIKEDVVVIIGNKKWYCRSTEDVNVFKMLGEYSIDVPGSVICVSGDPLWGKVIINPETINISEADVLFFQTYKKLANFECLSCDRCRSVCPLKLKKPHMKRILNDKKGKDSWENTQDCIGCGLCWYFCPVIT